MKNVTCILLTLGLFVMAGTVAGDELAQELSVDSSCEIDLNDDGQTDIAFIAETSRGYELIVLLRKARSYKTFLLYQGKPAMRLSCHQGGEFKTAGGTTYQTNGAYLMLLKFGKPSIAYFWSRRKFAEVWLAE